jgi:4-nitrophenyl phosphatase
MMIDSLSPRIKALILDMDGVLWKGDESIGDLPGIFSKISAKGLQVIFATNNSTKDANQYVHKLAQFGVVSKKTQIVNSAMAVTMLVKKRFPKGGPVFIVGEDGLANTLLEEGFYHDEISPIAIVAGLDRKLTYDKIGKATLFIRDGIPFFGTNPDRTFPTPQGLQPGAGAVLAIIEVSTDVKPIIAGKPFPAMMHLALERLGTLPEETLVVGDRLDTDIAGGQSVGCRTALVLSGVTRSEDVISFQPQPDLIAADLNSLLS